MVMVVVLFVPTIYIKKKMKYTLAQLTTYMLVRWFLPLTSPSGIDAPSDLRTKGGLDTTTLVMTTTNHPTIKHTLGRGTNG